MILDVIMDAVNFAIATVAVIGFIACVAMFGILILELINGTDRV